MGRLIAASAPGRCGILGNPSDIYGGKVLSCSVEARNRCTLVEGGLDLPKDTRLWDAATKRFPLGRAWGVLWHCEVPRSSGLSGSTALLAATLACVLAARGEPLDLSGDRRAFSELVRDVERHDAGIMCGYQDATMVVHGGLNLMDFAGKHPVNPGPLPSVQPLLADLPFLLVTTGVERLSGSVHGPMADRWMEGERAVVEVMAALPSLAEQGASALGAGDRASLASLMRENQRLIAGIGGSGDAVDRLIADCEGSGARAAKLAGAGMGGTVIALADDPDDLESRLRVLGYSRFGRPAIRPGLRFETSA